MNVSITPHEEFSGIFKATLEDGSQRLATENLAAGRNVYGERLITYRGLEYRLWDAFRSKLSAAILKGIHCFPIKSGDDILYLGAASGTTASHVSDIVGQKGQMYCIEFAARSIRELVNNVCAYRPNMSPILEDARSPEKYALLINRKVDEIYCDVAQPEQARIVADNADYFLKPSGWIMLALKAQSIDVTKKPSEVYRSEVKVLEKRGFSIEELVELEPYDKAHAMILARHRL